MWLILCVMFYADVLNDINFLQDSMYGNASYRFLVTQHCTNLQLQSHLGLLISETVFHKSINCYGDVE